MRYEQDTAEVMYSCRRNFVLLSENPEMNRTDGTFIRNEIVIVTKGLICIHGDI